MCISWTHSQFARRNSLRHRRAMTITARVHNRCIELPPEVDLPEGAEVRVTLPEVAVPAADGLTLYDTLSGFIGMAQGLPEDFAAEHDHYLHGTPKRSQR